MKIKIDREEVGRLLAEAEECPSEDTFYLLAPVMAELCRAWLALDAAPEATAHEGHDPETIEVSAWDTGIAPGTTVRLVPTHSAGGE